MCLCDQSLVTVAFLWEKLSQPQFYKDLTRKTTFFEGWSCFKFNNLGLALGANLEFYTSVTKRLKLKVGKFRGLIPTFLEVTGKKLVVGGRGLFALPLSFCKTEKPIREWGHVRCKWHVRGRLYSVEHSIQKSGSSLIRSKMLNSTKQSTQYPARTCFE